MRPIAGPKTRRLQLALVGQASFPQPSGCIESDGEMADALAGILQRARLLDGGVHQRFLLDDPHPEPDPGDAAMAGVVIQRLGPFRRRSVLAPQSAVVRQLHDVARAVPAADDFIRACR